MVTNNTTVSGFARTRGSHGFMMSYGHAIAAPAFGLRPFGVKVGVMLPTIDPDQGHIVSISRGSPPPKKR